MNVAHQLAQIPVALTKDGFVPPLQHVADLLIFPIVVLSVTRQHSLHDAANRICLTLDQQVHMIGHEAVSVNEEWQSSLLDFEQREKLLVVIVAVKDLLSVIAARDYVIEAALDFNA